ncbi:histone deacetylase complex subunit SAP130 isoform X1 [Tribolium madens]|uniref:histone deacetylase complex subunit SAP130 isoform X1 n=1 Tax=Tribolium madens TaxID=41895 RepID=UPI001CF75B03|nr:histone deacetylase complex subunit SAP130 isoform X1 [Tribolium madens]
MSGNGDEGKESHKSLPLDLARTQITTVGKAPLLMTSQALRGMRVLTQGTPPNSGQVSNAPTIITTNIVPHTVFKPDAARTSSASITIQRPAQITLSTAPVPCGTTYHVPRGPAVVANLAAPRSNVASVRAPMVVAAQASGFVRPPRTPSPAQGTAWLTNTSNGSQIKGATTVLSSPVRGASVTGKPQLVSRAQTGLQNVSTIRPGTTILHSAITIGHSFKPGQNASGIQGLGNVTIAQVLPSRTQAVVYSANTSGQFTATPRLTVSSSQNQRQNAATRPVVTTARLTIPVNVTQTSGRLVAPQATVLTSGARITAVASQPSSVIGTTANRIVSTQPNVTIGRLSVAASPAQVSNSNIIGQTRTLNLLAVANTSQPRSVHTQATKVITQPAQGAIHFTPIPAAVKTTQTVVTAANRTVNVPTAIVSQRQSAVVSSQTIPIASVYSQQGDNQQGQTPTANVFIPLSSVPRRTSPSPTTAPQTSINTTTSSVTTYSLASTYFYDGRSFGQQPTSFAALPQAPTQQIRPSSLNTQVHGIVTNQQMRFNPVMVVDQNRTQQFSGQSELNSEQSQSVPTKMTSSPRPSILRKRDHEGSPLKAAKNLTPVLTNLTQQPLPSISPPSRPDSRGNGHSSGGSTTISATSSPGLAEVNEDSMPHAPMNKEDEGVKPPMEMSPRKKPRKQQLTGSNDIDEHNDDMQFITDSSLKKEQEDSDGNQSDEPRDGAPEAGQVTTVRKPASASLLNSYRQTWKATHNHYLRYSDVRPKDERRPTIMDLANQYRVQEKVNGWKIYHLSTQMEDLAEQEQQVYNQLNELLKNTESQEALDFEKDINRINELIKGNLQRIKIINDGMIEAKTQIMKIFDHKGHVTDIINRCASKRNFKKRDKS